MPGPEIETQTFCQDDKKVSRITKTTFKTFQTVVITTTFAIKNHKSLFTNPPSLYFQTNPS